MIETLCSTVRTKTAPLNKLGQSIILSVFYAQQSNRINVETVTDTVAVSLLFIVMAQGYINHPLPPRSSRGPASLPDQVTVTLEGMWICQWQCVLEWHSVSLSVSVCLSVRDSVSWSDSVSLSVMVCFSLSVSLLVQMSQSLLKINESVTSLSAWLSFRVCQWQYVIGRWEAVNKFISESVSVALSVSLSMVIFRILCESVCFC